MEKYAHSCKAKEKYTHLKRYFPCSSIFDHFRYFRLCLAIILFMGSKRSNPDMWIKLVKSLVQTGLRLLSTWWLILDTFLSWQGVLAFSYIVLTSGTLKVNPNICWNSQRCWNIFNSEAKDVSAEKAEVYLQLLSF